MITLKPELEITDFFRLHPKLISIYGELAATALRRHGVIPTITSMLRPKTTDSGVHEGGRALDCSRHQYTRSGKIARSIPEDKIQALVSYINIMFPRSDGKDTCIYHDTGSGDHFHIQTGFDKLFETYELENKRLVSSRGA